MKLHERELERLREIVRVHEGKGTIELFAERGRPMFLFRGEGWSPGRFRKFSILWDEEARIAYVPAI